MGSIIGVYAHLRFSGAIYASSIREELVIPDFSMEMYTISFNSLVVLHYSPYPLGGLLSLAVCLLFAYILLFKGVQRGCSARGSW